MTTAPAEYKKPVPRPYNPEHTKPFWEAAKRHELVIPHCKRCSRYHFYPREMCPFCFSKDLDWVKASGQGRLYSWTAIRQPQNPNFQGDIPYAFSIVELAEGVRMISWVVGCRIPEDLKIDMPLVVEWDDVTPEWTLPKFRPA